MENNDNNKNCNNDRDNLEKKLEEQSIKKEKRKKLIIRTSITITVCLFIMGILVVFALAWQDKYTPKATCNAFYVASGVFFLVAWLILMTNLNVLSPIIYGLKNFFLIIVGKKPKETLHEYQENIKANPVKKTYYIIPFIMSLLCLIIAVILHIIYY